MPSSAPCSAFRPIPRGPGSAARSLGCGKVWMTMMADEDRAAEYALGVLTREEREAVRRAAATDPALAEEIENWNEQLASLLLDAPEVEPPADMFDRIKAAIAASAKPQAAPAGSRTVRADEGRWEQLCPGVERKLLWHD